MVSYEIEAVILSNHVEGSLPKGLAKKMGLSSRWPHEHGGHGGRAHTTGGAKKWMGERNGVESVVFLRENKLQRELFENVYVYFSYGRYIRLSYSILVHHGWNQ